MVKLSCYLVLIFGTLSAYFTNTRGECRVNQDIEKLYKELNCSPVKDSQDCATSYDCSSIFSIKNDKCYYQGKEINLGERIDKEEIQSTCTPTCTCFNSGGKATLDCAHYDCPEFFQPPLKPNCIRTYSHDSCCATGTVCKDSQTKTLAKCEYNGKVYLEGQKFEAEGKRCKNCICQPGFNGTLESPWCEEVQCDPQLFHLRKVQESCAPVFYGDDSCCPISFHCPSEPSSTETQESTESNVTPVVQKTSDGAKCKFGNQTIEIGQKVSTTEHCTECSCELPPLVTCVVNAACYQDRSE